MWPISYFLAWILKLCGYSAPYKRFAGVKQRPKQDRDRETIQGASDAAHFMVFLSFLIAISIWMGSPSNYKTAPLWIVLMAVVAIGMRIGGRVDRSDLALRREEKLKEQGLRNDEFQRLEECRRRRERRDAIRAGQIEDDGLSDWGRQLAVNPELTARVDKMEGITGVSLARGESVFDLEDRDKKIEAAWKRKVAADAAWEKILAKGGYDV